MSTRDLSLRVAIPPSSAGCWRLPFAFPHFCMRLIPTMPPQLSTVASTSLTISNPLVLYRSLLATKVIDP